MENTNYPNSVYKTIIERAWENNNFKQHLIASPEEALQAAGISISKANNNVKLKVVDQSDPSKIYINLSHKLTNDVELSDEQLEAIAGGGSGSVICKAAPNKVELNLGVGGGKGATAGLKLTWTIK